MFSSSKNKKKSFVFFGSPRFAEIFLSEIISAGYIPDAVICNPDRPVGRKKILTPPPVKILAEKNNIPVLQPEKITPDIIPQSEYAIVAAYSKIIPQSIIEIFPRGIIGVHPSLLPTFRGASPIQSALLSGNTETGTSLFLIDKEVDHGPLIAQKKISIAESDNYASGEEKLARLGAKIFVENINLYLEKKLLPQNQNHEQATFTKKFIRDDAFISEKELREAQEGKNAESVLKKIKAFSTEPGAWTIQNMKQVKLLDGVLHENKLILTCIQIEGKKPQKPN